MPFLPGSSPPSEHASRTVQLKPAITRRFYQPLVLLVSLNRTITQSQSRKPPDLIDDTTLSPGPAFHVFVNKLGQLCDSKRGGNTVTAFVVLKMPDIIQYRFASNQRTTEEYNRAKRFITDIIRTLRDVNADNLQDMRSVLLRKALSFVRPRIEIYVAAMKENAEMCINACKHDDTDESLSIAKVLEIFKDLLSFSDNEELDNAAYSGHTEKLIEGIALLYKSDTDNLIRNRTKEGEMNESRYWSELRHAMGRLLSYLQAIRVLVSTTTRFPELFEEFEVHYISSSTPAYNPVKGTKNLCANSIIGRMTSDTSEIEEHRMHAQQLQVVGLDDKIRVCAASDKFRPIVHAEVLLLDSLERDGGTHHSRFFKSYKYIGCSKPTCRLCDYYFSLHPSRVEVRPTHRNLYHLWRMPDVYEEEGEAAEKKREKLMDKMLIPIRSDTFKTLVEKLPDGKKHDSNTEPTYPVDSVLSHGPQDVDFLTSTFGNMGLGSSAREVVQESEDFVSSYGSTLSAGVSDDEGDGGVGI